MLNFSTLLSKSFSMTMRMIQSKTSLPFDFMKSTYPLLFSISLDAVAFGMKRIDDVDSKESIKIVRQKCIRNVKLKFLSYFDFFIVWLFIFVCDIVLILVSLLLSAIVRFSITFILLFLAILFTSILVYF